MQEWEKRIAEANSPDKVAAVKKTEESGAEFKKKFEDGLITPLEYAQQMAMLWYGVELILESS